MIYDIILTLELCALYIVVFLFYKAMKTLVKKTIYSYRLS